MGLERLLEESKALSGQDRRRAKELAERARALALESENPVDQARAANRSGAASYELGDFESALRLYVEASRLAQEAGEEGAGTAADALNNIGILHYFWGSLDRALDYYRRSLEILRTLGDEERIASALNNLGAVAYAAQRYEEAQDFFDGSIELYSRLERPDRLASCHNNVGLVLLALDRVDEALERFDLARELSLEAEDGAEEAISESHRGLALAHQGRHLEAREAGLAALRLRRRLEDRAGIAMSLLGLGQIEHEAGESQAALLRVEEALERARGLEIPEIQMNALNLLSEIRSSLGDTAGSLEAFRGYHEVHGRLLDQESRKKLAEARALFEVEKQDAEIRRLRRLRDSQRMVGWSLVAGVTLLLLVVGLLVSRNRLRARNQREIETKNRELRRAHQELERASRVEVAHLGRVVSLGELTAAVAHELNQPLAAIVTNAQLAGVLVRDPAGADLEDAIDDIALGARRAWELLHHLRRLARRGEVESRVVDLRDAGEEAAELVRAEARLQGVDLVVDWPESPLPVVGDPIHLQQVILNLLHNAIAAVGEVDGASLRTVWLRGRREGEEALVEVEDTGPPLPDEVFDQILKPFFTTKAEGLGMGLAIARRLIEAHDGSLEIRRRCAHGLVATVRLKMESRVFSVEPAEASP